MSYQNRKEEAKRYATEFLKTHLAVSSLGLSDLKRLIVLGVALLIIEFLARVFYISGILLFDLYNGGSVAAFDFLMIPFMSLFWPETTVLAFEVYAIFISVEGLNTSPSWIASFLVWLTVLSYLAAATAVYSVRRRWA